MSRRNRKLISPPRGSLQHDHRSPASLRRSVRNQQSRAPLCRPSSPEGDVRLVRAACEPRGRSRSTSSARMTRRSPLGRTSATPRPYPRLSAPVSVPDADPRPAARHRSRSVEAGRGAGESVDDTPGLVRGYGRDGVRRPLDLPAPAGSRPTRLDARLRAAHAGHDAVASRRPFARSVHRIKNFRSLSASSARRSRSLALRSYAPAPTAAGSNRGAPRSSPSPRRWTQPASSGRGSRRCVAAQASTIASIGGDAARPSSRRNPPDGGELVSPAPSPARSRSCPARSTTSRPDGRASPPGP